MRLTRLQNWFNYGWPWLTFSRSFGDFWRRFEQFGGCNAITQIHVLDEHLIFTDYASGKVSELIKYGWLWLTFSRSFGYFYLEFLQFVGCNAITIKIIKSTPNLYRFCIWQGFKLIKICVTLTFIFKVIWWFFLWRYGQFAGSKGNPTSAGSNITL